ncbi:unnamed protein product [Acanthoscelides obtectus]|uniref:MADF domain-containing protein n=1 Tax=Acanthoscelides obtectus TaxID=200917 RepID=A0A9P0P6Z0_ACAOB|nr:unnamed protein product [Acanthoscelides obtectus]CAK1669309.1 hypothetical protein AOBTE_LOCUS26950 [Acanthoscelides obtectus]
MCAAPQTFTQFEMGSERWSSENNITFMNLYREQENLWNCFDKNYKKRDMRKASLEYIANEMSLVNTSEPIDTPSGSKILEDDVSRDIDDKTDNRSIDSSDTSLIKHKNPVQVENKIKHNITQETSGIAAAINELKQLNSTIQTSSCSQQCDEYDVIGKHVAIQLRGLPLLDFIDAKDEIQQDPVYQVIHSQDLSQYLIGPQKQFLGSQFKQLLDNHQMHHTRVSTLVIH